MRCIVCLKERPPSVEHVFPLAIGGTLTTERVCESCNAQLGATADAALCDHPLIAMRRGELKLPGNSGQVPDPLEPLFRLGTLASEPARRVKVTTNRKTGTAEVRMLYSVKEAPAANGGTLRQITIDKRDVEALGTILQRERKRVGIAPLNDDELERTIRDIVANNANTIDRPEVIYQLNIDIVEYRKGILKIAYELAFLWLGEEYLSDPIAEKLRAFILGVNDEETLGVQAHFGAPNEIDSFRLWSEPKNCHIAFSLGRQSDVAIGLKIFDIFAAVIRVSDSSERYLRGPLDPDRSRFLCIDPVARTKRESSFMDETGRMAAMTLSRAPPASR